MSNSEGYGSDYAGIGNYYPPVRRDYSRYSNRRYSPINSNYIHGNRYGDTRYTSNKNNYYRNKYRGDIYDDGYDLNQFTNLMSNILQNNYDKSEQRNTASILKNIRENQRWAMANPGNRGSNDWKYGNDGVMDDYPSGHRDRREVTMATPSEKNYDITGNTEDVSKGKKRRETKQKLHECRSCNKSGHYNIKDMTLDELKEKLKNTLEKVHAIKERERMRTHEGQHLVSDYSTVAEHKFKDAELSLHSVKNSGARTKHIRENIKEAADNIPSIMPNTKPCLPVTDKSTVIETSSETNAVNKDTRTIANSGVGKSLTLSEINNSTSNNKLNDTKKKDRYLGETVVNSSEIVNSSENKFRNYDFLRHREMFERRNSRKRKKKKRRKRHVGPHDEGGLQRLISTGTCTSVLVYLKHFHS